MKLNKRLSMILAVSILTQSIIPIYAITKDQQRPENPRKTQALEVNKIPNGGFETNTNGKPNYFDIQSGKATVSLDSETVHKGNTSVKVTALDATEATRIEKLTLSNMTIDLGTVDYANPIQMDYKISPVNAVDKRVLWQSMDSSILEITKEGYLIPKKPGVVDVVAFTKEHHIKEVATITLTGKLKEEQIVPAKTLKLPPTVELAVGEGGKLEIEVSPNNYTHLENTFKSSNTEVVTVLNDGRLHAKAPGTAKITVTDINGATASTEVTVTQQQHDKFDQVRQQWYRKIPKRHTTKEYDAMVDAYWHKMNTDPNRLCLWEDIETDYTNASVLGSKVLSRLVKMATATTLVDSKYYKDDELLADIADAIVWINEKYLGLENYRRDWHWEIGIPKQLVDLYMLTYAYLSNKEIQKGMTYVLYDSNPVGIEAFSAANLVDTARSMIGSAVLLKNEAELNRYVAMSLNTLNYINKGNGFYTDGSFVEHDNIAYTGSYGTVLLGNIEKLLAIFRETQFDIGSHPSMTNLYTILEKSYLPLISFGALMDNTRGRAISRPADNDHLAGHGVIVTVAKIGYIAPEPYKTSLLSKAKRIIIQDKEHFNKMDNQAINKLMADDSILPAPRYSYSHEFGAMNRRVHHTEKFGLGISKCSNRVATFEHLNGENKKGWHTGYGMTTVYNLDVNQYNDGYWATIDPYRLPGTTVDTGKRESSHAQYGDGEGKTKNSWAGGVTLNNTFGTSGMDLQTIRQKGSTLTAYKSWFMFDDTVIALGSNINSRDDRNVETIVENRKINLEGTNKLTANGQEYGTSLGNQHTIQSTTWAHLEGRVIGADIGYYFPKPTDLIVIKEQRTGNYSEINEGKNEEYTNSFATLVINHGKAPHNAKYAYALVPGATAEQMESFSTAPSFEVVANENTVHAIRHFKHNILAANFYSDKPQQVGYLQVDGPAAIMTQEENGYLKMAIADPTMERNQLIVELVGKKCLKEIEKSPGIEVQQTKKGIRLIVDTKNSYSESYEVTLMIDENH